MPLQRGIMHRRMSFLFYTWVSFCGCSHSTASWACSSQLNKNKLPWHIRGKRVGKQRQEDWVGVIKSLLNPWRWTLVWPAISSLGVTTITKVLFSGWSHQVQLMIIMGSTSFLCSGMTLYENSLSSNSLFPCSWWLSINI